MKPTFALLGFMLCAFMFQTTVAQYECPPSLSNYHRPLNMNGQNHTWGFSVDGSGISEADMRFAIQTAINTWLSLINLEGPVLTFTETSFDDASVKFYFFDFEAGAPCALYDESSNEQTIRFNTRVGYSKSNINSTMVHEVGHIFFGGAHNGDGIMRNVQPPDCFSSMGTISECETKRLLELYTGVPSIGFTIQNTFSDNLKGGTMLLDSQSVTIPTAFGWYQMLRRPSSYPHTLTRVNHQVISNKTQGFTFWQYPQYSTSASFSVSTTGGLTYDAWFNQVYIATITAAGAEGTVPGHVKINDGSPVSTPTTTDVFKNDSVKLEAVAFSSQNVDYGFAYWTNNRTNDTVRTASSKFKFSDHTTYAARYIATPWLPSNVSVGGTPYDNVHISWSEHPHPNVNQYRIWRMVKPKNGNQGSATLIETVNRGTTSYVDPDYIVLSSYAQFLLSYSVQSVFTAGNEVTYSGTDYHQLFGGMSEKSASNSRLSGGRMIPVESALSSYPNPFNPMTTIRYQIADGGHVRLTVYDLTGRVVAELVNESMAAGYYLATFNGNNLPSGVYVARLSVMPAAGRPIVQSIKLQLIR